MSLSTLLAGAVALEDNDTVRGRGSDEGSAVRRLSPAAVIVECDVAQAVAECRKQELSLVSYAISDFTSRDSQDLP